MLPGRIRTKMDEETENKKMQEGDQGKDYTPPSEVAQRFKVVNIGAIALFASKNIMLCLEKCPYNHRKAKF